MGIFVKIWLFTMPAHQIWSCHVTQEANLKKKFFFLILHLILGLGNVTKFLVEKLSTLEVINQKTSRGRGRGGWKTPTRAFMVTYSLTSLNTDATSAGQFLN